MIFSRELFFCIFNAKARGCKDLHVLPSASRSLKEGGASYRIVPVFLRSVCGLNNIPQLPAALFFKERCFVRLHLCRSRIDVSLLCHSVLNNRSQRRPHLFVPARTIRESLCLRGSGAHVSPVRYSVLKKQPQKCPQLFVSKKKHSASSRLRDSGAHA